MSAYTKSAAVFALVVVAWNIATSGIFGSAILVSGSGGLGAISFGLTEMFLEFAIGTIPIWIVIYWRARKKLRAK